MNETLKNSKGIECPICHRYFFEDKQESDKPQDYCSQCGWVYDLEQMENPDLANKSNELSLNNYKKMYEELISEDPNYNYFGIEQTKSPHNCPVCGKYVFDNDNSFDICPFCGWEDDGIQLSDPNYDGGANDLSLNQYKEEYKNIIKDNPNYIWENKYK